jgi:hypothetical protein
MEPMERIRKVTLQFLHGLLTREEFEQEVIEIAFGPEQQLAQDLYREITSFFDGTHVSPKFGGE